MTQEDKKLLLQDLCSRLPYGVVCNTSKGNGHLCSINQTIFGIVYGINIKATERDYFNDREEIIKPYLRPMSSMTDEEIREFTRFTSISQHRFFIGDSYFWYNTYEEEDWLNAHHFDYRGLIDKGLAIEAPKGMYN